MIINHLLTFVHVQVQSLNLFLWRKRKSPATFQDFFFKRDAWWFYRRLFRLVKKKYYNFTIASNETRSVYSLFAIIQSTFYRLIKGQHYLKKIYISNFKLVWIQERFSNFCSCGQSWVSFKNSGCFFKLNLKNLLKGAHILVTST